MDSAPKILLAGLDANSHQIVSSIVSRCCSYVMSANDANQALSYFRSQHPQIVVLDSTIEGMAAVNFTKALCGEDPDVLIVVTGLYQDENVVDCLKAGASDFLPKPINEDDLGFVLSRFGSLINRRNSKRFYAQLFDGARLDLTLKSSTEALNHAVAIISNFLTSAFAGHELVRIELGIQELLRNSLEHGNLAIDYEKKKELCEVGKFDDFVKQQSAIAQQAGKTITVVVELCGNMLTCIVTDAGAGFNWRKHKSNSAASSIETNFSGRGLLLISKIFDSIDYNEKGNQVICKKKLNMG